VLCQQPKKTQSRSSKQTNKGSKASPTNTDDYATLLAEAIKGFSGSDSGFFDSLGESFHDMAGDAEGVLRMIHQYTHDPSFKKTLESNINEFKEVADEGLDNIERWNDPQYPMEFILAKTYGVTLVRNFLRDLDADFIIRNIDSIAGAVYLLQAKLSDSFGTSKPKLSPHQDL
jgi:hypothetical protein